MYSAIVYTPQGRYKAEQFECCSQPSAIIIAKREAQAWYGDRNHENYGIVLFAHGAKIAEVWSKYNDDQQRT